MKLDDQVSSLAGGSNGLAFEASDVTGTQSVALNDVQPTLPAGKLAEVVATRMSLPADVPWALRDDATSAWLDDGRPIGEQVGPNARLTLTPRTHLG